MKLGLGSYSFRWSIGIVDRQPDHPMTPMEVLDAAHARGLKVVQYADNMPLHRLSRCALERLAGTAAERGITLELGTQSFDAEQVTQYLGIAETLDAPLLRVALDAADAELAVADLAAQLRPLLDRAASENRRIAIENHFNYPSPRMVELLETLDHPALGVCLDVANSICANEWPEETVRLLAPFAINLHLKDYEIIPDPYGVGFRIHGVPLGTGRAPIRWIVDQLGHCPPDMSVLLEQWLMPTEGLDAARAAEHDWLDRSIATARQYIPE